MAYPALMDRPLAIGIAGAGFNAFFHLEAFVQVRDCVIGGVCSRTTGSAQAVADRARALDLGDPQVFEGVEAMAADPSIDALWINAPNFTRVDMFEAVVRGNAQRDTPLLGIACEKPLARNLVEAEQVVALLEDAGIPTGYLENQVFTPAVVRGKSIIWDRAVPLTGRPYLARAAEEHSGPHKPWFWQGSLQGGGVLNDMMCHSVETARFLLTEPGAPRDSIRPIEVRAHIASLKWTRPEYVERLKQEQSAEVDYATEPSEDYAHATITYEDGAGRTLVSEVTTSWSFVGAGLRLSFELLGPEYSMRANSLDTGLEVFLSRRVTGDTGEDLVEKQNAEQGVMPVVPDEASAYGYAEENRHMVRCFREGRSPALTFADGLEVVRLLMAAYRSAETGRPVDPTDPTLREFVPAVAQGTWRP